MHYKNGARVKYTGPIDEINGRSGIMRSYLGRNYIFVNFDGDPDENQWKLEHDQLEPDEFKIGDLVLVDDYNGNLEKGRIIKAGNHYFDIQISPKTTYYVQSKFCLSRPRPEPPAEIQPLMIASKAYLWSGVLSTWVQNTGLQIKNACNVCGGKLRQDYDTRRGLHMRCEDCPGPLTRDG